MRDAFNLNSELSDDALKLNASKLEPGSLVMLDDIAIPCSLNLDDLDLFDPYWITSQFSAETLCQMSKFALSLIDCTLSCTAALVAQAES